MEVIVKEGKREFKITVAIEYITNEIEALKSKYEDKRYVRYGTSPEFHEKDFTYINKEEYIDNIEKFKCEFMEHTAEDALKKIIEDFPRKKNGTFNRRNTKLLAECSNCEVIHEWHNTWIYQVIKVVADSDIELRIVMYREIDTPC